MRYFFGALAVLSGVCGGCSAEQDDGSGGPEPTTTVSSPGPTASSPTATSTAEPLAPGAVLSETIVIPDVPPGGQDTVCVYKRLANPDPVKVVEVRGFISQGSHHLIVNRTNFGTINETPTSCSDLQGSDQSRVLIAQQPETAFRLPDGVAYTLAAQQYLTLELHYINTTDEVLDVQGRVEFLLAEGQGESLTEATMNFTGAFGFSLPAQQQTTITHFEVIGSPGTPMNVFALTSHTHSLGVRATIERAASQDAPGTPIHESLSWEEPPLDEFSPPMLFDGSDGLRLTCQFDNTTNATVSFGTRFEDEMCFMWVYMYGGL